MILITGGGGLLGLNLARDLVDKGEDVLLLQRHEIEPPSFLTPFWGNQIKGVVGDVLEWPFICKLIAEYSVNSVVHAAAIWPGRAGTTSLYQVVSVNVGATVNMLEATRIFGLYRMTFISSTTVYMGLDVNEECREDMDLPITAPDAVSATKKASEIICSFYAKTYRLSVPSVRVARIYGPTAHWGRNPLERMVKNAVEGHPADILDTYQESYTCPIYAKDCAKGISFIHLAKELQHNIYNVSDGNYVAWKKLANIVKEVVPGSEIRLGNDKRLERSPPPVSIDRLKAEGWTPEYAELRKGIQAYVDYMKEGKY